MEALSLAIGSWSSEGTSIHPGQKIKDNIKTKQSFNSTVERFLQLVKGSDSP